MKIAFLGTGLMGRPMAERLLLGNIDLGIYNRSLNKTAELKDKGAAVLTDPIEAMENAEVIIIMLSEFYVIQQVLFKDEYNNFSDKTIIMMSTIASEESCLLEEKIKCYGGKYLEAPVLGSIPQATEGVLSILVGGEETIAEKYKPLLENMGQFNYIGKVGDASSVKLALNQMIATETAAISMSLGYLLNKGIDINPFMKILRKSALYAPTFDKKLKNYLDDNFENPNFPLKHMLKDVKLIEKDFGKEKVDTSILKSIVELLSSGVSNGLGEMDYSALFRTINPKKRISKFGKR